MSDTLAYIEAYFEKKLNAEENQRFEQRCVEDTTFAQDVAFYIASKEAIRHQLLQEKKQQWVRAEAQRNQHSSEHRTPVKKMSFKRWLPYAVAASLLLAILVYVLYPSHSPQQLATRYVQQQLTQLSQTMDGASDSLQLGIRAYNQREYDVALSLFQNLYKDHPEHSEAKEYIGLSYLMKKEYDQALVHFEELAAQKLFSNPGSFLTAVTLLQRNREGDKAAAKKLLEQVRDKQLEGHGEATEWLRKW